MRFRRRRWAAIGPDVDVYVIDVTERWYGDQHGYWVFADPDWFAWATGTALGPPRDVARLNDRVGLALSDDPAENERVLYLLPAIMAQGGYAGNTERELASRLAGRQPLATLTAVEEADHQ